MNTEYLPEELLLKAAHQYGTPLYCYDARKITDQFQKLSDCLKGVKHQICFAVKANSNTHILKLIEKLGGGFDIVSGGELQRVKFAVGKAEKVVFAGVGKSKNEIKLGLLEGVRFFNVESEAELRVIAQIAKEMNKVASISYRINPDVHVDTHPYLTTGLRSSKFGIPLEELEQIWNLTKNTPQLKLVGVDCHLGSQLSDVKPFEAAYTEIIKYADKFRAEGAPIAYVDFGGGLAVSFSGHYRPLPLPEFGAMVKRIIGDRPYTALLEPGKFLVAEAGALITQVVYTKMNGTKKFLITDAGMNDLIRPSLYEAFHHIDVLGAKDDAPKEVVDVVGPVCESGCYFAKDRELSVAKEGDLLAIRDAGAYGFTMASNYNSRPLPAEVLIEPNGGLRCIRKRQLPEDLWKDELV